MGKVSALAFAFGLSCTLALADELKTTPVMLEDGRIVQAVVAKKQPFAVKHPKLHKAGRKLRRSCQVMLPVVQFAGSCAQIVYAIR